MADFVCSGGLKVHKEDDLMKSLYYLGSYLWAIFGYKFDGKIRDVPSHQACFHTDAIYANRI